MPGEIWSAFFEDSVAGSVQQYVENFTDQLRSANDKLLKANESLNLIDRIEASTYPNGQPRTCERAQYDESHRNLAHDRQR